MGKHIKGLLRKTSVGIFLFTSCIAPSDDADVLTSFGYASEAGLVFSGVKYKDGVGYYCSANLKAGGGNGGTNYTDIIGPGGFPGDSFEGSFREFWGITVGPTFRLASFVGVYAGLAYQMTRTWNKYYDSSHILDPSGHYYIQAGSHSDFGAEAGVDFIISGKWNLGLRANTISKSAVVMIGWKL